LYDDQRGAAEFAEVIECHLSGRSREIAVLTCRRIEEDR
jgi:hypothetical protein